jgi:heme-degrading monooxygenase HmoA
MSTVILINPFEVPADKEEKALAIWERVRDCMMQQPGYINTRLHRAINPDARFGLINVAEWESVDAFQAAVSSEEFLELTQGVMEEFPHFPALYEVIRR